MGHFTEMPHFYIMKKYLILLFIFIFANIPNFSHAKVFLKKNEALKQAFPNADSLVKEQVFLNNNQVDTIESIAKAKLNSKLYIFYVAKRNKDVLGYAVIETHTLRTTTETVMFVINPDGSLREAEILAFFEPLDYMPGNKWIDLFNNKPLNDTLKIGKRIPNITGATITSNSLTKAVRRVLAIYKVAFLKQNLLAEKEGN